MTDKPKRGGWSNPAAAENGKKGGHPFKPEGEKMIRMGVLYLSPAAHAALTAEQQRDGERWQDVINRLLETQT